MHRIRIVTFNIAHGRGLIPIQGFNSTAGLRRNLKKVADLILRLHPDIVALQEIDQRSRVTPTPFSASTRGVRG